MTRRGFILLCLLLMTGLLLRLGWSLSRGSSIENLPDQVEYLACAKAMLAHQPCSFVDPRFGQRVFAQRTVGYPAFLVLCGTSVTATRIVQCLLDTSAILAVFLIARRRLSGRRSLFAAALVAMNPFLVYFCSLLLTETLFTVMLVWSVYLMLNRRAIFLGVLLCSLGVLVRPSGLPMPLLLAFLAAWTLPGPRLWRSLGYAAASTLILLAILFPWALRNHTVLGHWVWLSTNGGITLYDGVHPGATGASDQSFLQAMPQQELRSLGELGRDAYFASQARAQIRQDPGRFLLLAVKKVARTWSPIPLSEQYGSSRLYVAVGLFYSLPLLVLAMLAIRWSWFPWPPRRLLLGPALAVTLMHAISVGSLRYRVPIEPLLAILAASVVLPRRRVSPSADIPPVS